MLGTEVPVLGALRSTLLRGLSNILPVICVRLSREGRISSVLYQIVVEERRCRGARGLAAIDVEFVSKQSGRLLMVSPGASFGNATKANDFLAFLSLGGLVVGR